ncbi:MAG TPA: Xaa-Pro dipeptidase [Kofleriaceae bacterium]|nr:Xaa-Pro dipeptidase [Kofleriaceae bacterium]
MAPTAQHRIAGNPAPLYAAHVAHLNRAYAGALAEAGYDALVVHSGGVALKSRFDDAEWPLRVNPTFAHWLPLAEPEAWLIVQPERRPRLLRAHQVSYWEGPPPAVGDEVWAELDAAEIAPDAVTGELPRGRVAFIGEDASRAAGAGFAAEHINPAALVAGLDHVRSLKTDYERECIAEANRRAVRGHQRVFGTFSVEDRSELDLHLLYLEVTAQDDHETPYKDIVAQGRHAGVLHHVFYDRQATRRPVQSLLVDAGATCRGYAADVTRTAIKGADGGAASVFADLIVRIEALQQEVCRRVRPGLSYEELHDQAHQMLAPILRELDMVRAGDDELVSTGVTRRFLPHGLGHSLGIQVHDVGCRMRPPRADNPFLRNTTRITPGQVFTIEPGCYFIPELMDEMRSGAIADRVNWTLLDEMGEFGGVRIEDNVAVLDHGIRNFTREAW